MSNRVTDQQTQNALITAFKLEGVLPEMEVSPTIIPIVEVAKLASALTVSQFERWGSALNGGPPLVRISDITNFTNPFVSGVDKVAPTSQVVSRPGTFNAGGKFGCAFPGGSSGVPSTDGLYRVTVEMSAATGATHIFDAELYDQSAFGDPAALGTFRGFLGSFQNPKTQGGVTVVFDIFVVLATLDVVNAFVLTATATGSVNGSGTCTIRITKVIAEIPDAVIYP